MTKRRLVVAILLVILVGDCIGCRKKESREENKIENKADNKIEDKKEATYTQLTKEEMENSFNSLNGTQEADIEYEGEIIRQIDGYFYDQEITSWEDAYELIGSMQNLLGIQDITKEVRFNLETLSGGDTVYCFDQYLDDIGVEGGEITISVNQKTKKCNLLENRIRLDLTNGTTPVNTNPKYTQEEAEKAACDYIVSIEGEEAQNADSKLFIEEDNESKKMLLIYRVYLDGGTMRNPYYVFLSADTLEVLRAHSLMIE